MRFHKLNLFKRCARKKTLLSKKIKGQTEVCQRENRLSPGLGGEAELLELCSLDRYPAANTWSVFYENAQILNRRKHISLKENKSTTKVKFSHLNLTCEGTLSTYRESILLFVIRQGLCSFSRQ